MLSMPPRAHPHSRQSHPPGDEASPPALSLPAWTRLILQVYERVSSRTRASAKAGGARPRAVLFEGPPGWSVGACCRPLLLSGCLHVN